MKALLAVLLLVVCAGIPAFLFFASAPVALQLAPAAKVLAAENTLVVTAASPHGVRSLTATLTQGQATSRSEYTQPANRWLFWRARLAPAQIALPLAAQPAGGFRSGPARLTLAAVANDFRAAETTLAADVVINLDPPRVVADGEQHYINQGGAELVTFTVSGYWTEAGVKVGEQRFRSFPLPGAGDPNRRFALFVFPWDAPADAAPAVYARNPAGVEATARFWYKLFPKKFRQRELDLSEAFLDKVLGELDPAGAGDKLARFLKINGELRRQNNAALAALREKTAEKFLWQPPFEQLTNSKVEAQFADVRSYRYGGKKVDQQTHLGFDLSVTAHVEVLAANRGQVVWADRLGIYGNCVVVDHGYGLQSIYAHLSEIGVKPEQMVERRGVLGKSGATGMAGGDHLHFSLQIDGVQTNPVEWWDAHWIQDRILSKVKME